MNAVSGRIVGPNGVFEGTVSFDGERISAVEASRRAGARDFGDAWILPGFIDVHLHGVGEFGMQKTEDILGAARMEPAFGTTGFLPTAMSQVEDEYVAAGRNVREARANRSATDARILGAHFEGPFLNPVRKGGMKLEMLRAPDVRECRRYLDECGDVLKLMTIAPELENGIETVRLLRSRGVVVSIGHSDATPEDFGKAFDAGLRHVCHLFNTYDRSEKSVRGIWPSSLMTAILANDAVACEIICDMHHVPSDAVKIASRVLAPDRFVAITDGMRGAGLPAGEHVSTDGRPYTTRTGVATTLEGNVIVGSVLTMDRAFANLVGRVGLDSATAARFVSSNPARALGAYGDRGSLEPGKLADLAVLDPEFQCVATYVGGALAHEAD